MRKWLIILAVEIALVLSGLLWISCGAGDEGDDDFHDWGDDADDLQDFLDAIPDPESLRLTLPASDSKGLDELAWLYEETVDFTRNVNGNVLMVLSWIDEITSYPPSAHEDDTYTWGPWRGSGLSMIELKFEMTRVSGQHFTYTLYGRPKDSDDPWTKLWWGEVEASVETQRRGIGTFTIDFDALHGIDPTEDYAGSVIVDYDTVTDGREIDVTYVEFVGEGNPNAEPISGTYEYHDHADHHGEFLFDALIDIHYEEHHGDQYGEREHLYFNTRWQGNGAGRSDVVATGGDLPDIEIGGSPVERYLISECWGDDFLRDYFCTIAITEDDSEYTVEEEGDPGSCVFSEDMPDIA